MAFGHTAWCVSRARIASQTRTQFSLRMLFPGCADAREVGEGVCCCVNSRVALSQGKAVHRRGSVGVLPCQRMGKGGRRG